MSTDLVRATPGTTWLLTVKWPHAGPLWTEADGWHPKLREPVEHLLREAQLKSKAPMLVSPPPPHLLSIDQEAAANGVLALVTFDVELGEKICQLQTVEAFPDV